MSDQIRIATMPSSPSSAANDPCSYPRETYQKAIDRYEARTEDLQAAQGLQSFWAHSVSAYARAIEGLTKNGYGVDEELQDGYDEAMEELAEADELLSDAQDDFWDAFQHMEDAEDVLLNCCADVGQAPQHMRILVRSSPVGGVKANADDFATRLAKLQAALVAAEEDLLAQAAALEQLAA